MDTQPIQTGTYHSQGDDDDDDNDDDDDVYECDDNDSL